MFRDVEYSEDAGGVLHRPPAQHTLCAGTDDEGREYVTTTTDLAAHIAAVYRHAAGGRGGVLCFDVSVRGTFKYKVLFRNSPSSVRESMQPCDYNQKQPMCTRATPEDMDKAPNASLHTGTYEVYQGQD